MRRREQAEMFVLAACEAVRNTKRRMRMLYPLQILPEVPEAQGTAV